MNKIIAIEKETCSKCGDEIKQGSFCYADDEDIICAECYKECLSKS